MSETLLTPLVIIVAAFFAILLFYGLAAFFNDFSIELKYLNNEIQRTRGADRKHWQRQKRKLWLSLLPFFKY